MSTSRTAVAPMEAAAARADIETFVLDHYPRLIRLAGSLTRDADGAQDAVQTALERAWRHRDALVDPLRLRSWLDQIVVREALRGEKQRGSRLARIFQPGPVEFIELAARTPEPADMAALRVAFAALPVAQRAVVALHLVSGYSVEETAALLGIPFDTVRSRLRAARSRLRTELATSEVDR